MARRKPKPVDPLEVVNRFVDAANRHDARAVAACVHRDFESLQPVHPVRNFKGSAQLLNNWRAIFRTEPGFRLTMLRSAVGDGTVWVELHGAGDAAEVAGIFIVGVENGLIRWVRVYSELIEQAPETETPGPILTAVPNPPEAEAAADEESEEGAVADEKVTVVEAVDAVEVADAAVTPQDDAEPAEAEPAAEVALAVEPDVVAAEEAASEGLGAEGADEVTAHGSLAEERPPTSPGDQGTGEEASAGADEAPGDAADGSLSPEPPPTWSSDQSTEEASVVDAEAAEDMEPAILEAERAADSGAEPEPEAVVEEPGSGIEKWRRRLRTKRPKGEA